MYFITIIQVKYSVKVPNYLINIIWQDLSQLLTLSSHGRIYYDFHSPAFIDWNIIKKATYKMQITMQVSKIRIKLLI